MSPHLERACMAAAGLVPISFDAPGPHDYCAGKMRTSKPQPLGICAICQRPSNDGPEMEPAARLVQGGSECLNFAPIMAGAVSRDASVSADQGGVGTVSHGGNCARIEPAGVSLG